MQTIEAVVREVVTDFESKVLIANELIVLAETLKAEAVMEIATIESKIINTKRLLGEEVIVPQELKPVVVTPEEIVEPVKKYEAKSFEYNNVIEGIDGAKINGSFLYNRKKYYYTASDNMARPMVYGAKDMNVIEACMEAIISNVDDTFYDNDFKDFCTNVNHADRYHIDLDREIMIYFAPDGSYKGYFQGKAFIWQEDKYKIPAYAMYKNSLCTDKYRPMKNIGQGELIARLCKDLQAKAIYLNDVVSEIKEEVVVDTNETTVTNDDNQGFYWDAEIEGNPADWNEEVDF